MNSYLYRVIFVQTYDYFTTPNQDHLRQKLLVILFLLLEDSQEIDFGHRFLYSCALYKRIVFTLNSILGPLDVDSLMVIHPLNFILVKN